MRLPTLCLAALLLTSCANNATVTYAWKADDIQSRDDLSGVLVLAVTTHADIRARFEQEFADALAARDLNAQHKSLHLEANLYVVADGEHLWQAAVGIEETQEMDKLLHGFIVALVDQLKQDQLVR